MDVLRKLILHIVAAALIIGAVAFHVTVVAKTAKARTAKVSDIERRARELEGFAKDVPNPGKIQSVKIQADKQREQLDKCEEFLGSQPREGHTRLFFKNEDPTHPDYGRAPVGAVAWLTIYNTMIERLREDVAYSGIMGDWIKDDNSVWGESVPTEQQIQDAQEAYWFQFDLAEMLTDGTEAAFEKLIDNLSPEEGAFPQSVADLVITRDPSRLDEPMRVLPIEKLKSVLEAIVINADQADLATIFDKYLADEDREKNFDWQRVESLTLDDNQRMFLAKVRPTDEPDHLYHQRFVDYVMELRSVRYRSDVIGLLEKDPDAKDLVGNIEKLDQEERERIRQEISSYSRTRLATTIANIVAIRNEEDYKLVRDNHRLKLASVENLSFARPYESDGDRGGMGGGMGGMMGDEPGRRGGRPRDGDSGGVTRTKNIRDGMAYVWSFKMRVKIEFERVPVFVRRFLNNSWHYNLVVEKVDPVGGTSGGTSTSSAREPGMSMGRTSMRSSPGRRPGGLMDTPPDAMDQPFERRAMQGEATDEETVEGRQYVYLECTCEAFQYTPLMKKIAEREAANRSDTARGTR